MAKKPKNYHRLTAAVVAACLLVALGVTAGALLDNRFKADAVPDDPAFYNAVLGTGLSGHESFVREFGLEDGSTMTEQYPASERVAVDKLLAESLLGDYVIDVGEGVKFNGYTLTVRSFILDENGIGAMTYTLDNPNGLGVDENGNALDAAHAPVSFTVTDAAGNVMDAGRAAVTGTMTETGAEFVAAITPFYPCADGDLTVTFRWMGEESGKADLTLPAAKRVPVQKLTADGTDISVSPLGMVIRENGDNIKQLSIVYQDGSTYTVEDESTVNTNLSSIFTDGTASAYAFNRLVDVRRIAEVQIGK